MAFTVTCVFLIPGFAAQFGHEVGVGWERLYSLGWVVGCAMSSVLYFGLCMVGDFCRRERAMRFEEAYEVQGLFMGEGTSEGVSLESEEKGESVVVGQEGPKNGLGETKVTESER